MTLVDLLGLLFLWCFVGAASWVLLWAVILEPPDDDPPPF